MPLMAQKPEIKPGDMPLYYRKEEIIYDDKRYRIHNNYLTLGGGFLGSTIRGDVQKNIGIDFQFHIRRQQFQAGVMMSGDAFRSNNNVQMHLGYGYRKETITTNVAAYFGATYYTGVVASKDSIPVPIFYDGFGAYACIQGIYKISYDFGVGAELFGELNVHQNILGIRFIAFFSGAYRGAKRNYNPNVRPHR